MPIDDNDNPIPWMTYPAISFLEKRIKNGMEVFEYSCGNSTFWWAKRVKKLISCEHDREWYQKMVKLIPANVELYQIDLEYGGAYSRKVSEYTRAFDVIVLDGRDRVNCAKNCLNALTKNGVIIWDNSDRESYTEGYNYLLRNGYKRIDFEGMGPVNAYSWCTSIFYKEENCLNI
jgi:predicted O-methyltransferase YrrM